MQTKAKSNSVITHALERYEGGQTLIVFKVKDAGEIRLDMAKLNPAVIERAAIHGLIQRISDAAAISRNPETGLPASVLDKGAAMSALIDHYHSGTAEWKRAGSGAGAVRGLLLEALVQAYPEKDRERLATWLKKRSAQERAALAVEPRIKLILDELRAKGTEAVDTEALLGELDEEGDEAAEE